MIYSDEKIITERIFLDKRVEPGFFEKQFILSFLSNIPLKDLKKIVDIETLYPKSEKEWHTAMHLNKKKGIELRELYECQLVKFKLKIEI